MPAAIADALGWVPVPIGDLIAFVALMIVAHEARQFASAFSRWARRVAVVRVADATPDRVPRGVEANGELGPSSDTAVITPSTGPTSQDAAPIRTTHSLRRPAADTRWAWVVLLLGVTLVVIGISVRKPASEPAA